MERLQGGPEGPRSVDGPSGCQDVEGKTKVDRPVERRVESPDDSRGPVDLPYVTDGIVSNTKEH